MRVATYARVSTEQQSERGHSLAEQKASLAAYCERHGFTLIEHVQDAAISGKITERPGVLRLKELAAARVIDAVVCVRIDRLSRTAWAGEALIEEFDRRGVKIVFTDQTFAPGAVGDLTRGILGHVAQFEHSLIRDRTVAGKLQKAKDRQVMPMGRAPFGYRQVTVAQAKALAEFAGRDGELVEEPDEAAVVREVFRRYAEGEGLTDLCRWLQEHSTAGPRGIWRHGRLKSMLRNSAYAGTRTYQKVQRQKDRAPKLRPAEDHVAIPCLALIDPKTWAEVQGRLDGNARNVGRPTTEFILRGVVFCGICKNQDGSPRRCVGHRLNHNPTRPGYRTHRRYHCPTVCDSFRASCGVSMNAGKLEAATLRVLRLHLQPGFLAAKARALAIAELDATANVEVEHANLESQLRQLDREENQVMDLALSGFEQRLIFQRLQPLKRKRQQLRELLATAEERLARRQDPDEVAAKTEAIAAKAREALAQAEATGDDAAKQRLCQQFLAVTLWKKKQADIQVRVPEHA